MDQYARDALQKRMDRAIEKLKANRFEAEYLPDRQALLSRLDELMPKGCSCSLGGSMTLAETGVQAYLEQGDFQYYDRYAPGADQDEIFHKALDCDIYLTSSNAVTEDGRLYNIDGRGNRLAAMVYGPRQVIVIAGYNKLVPNLESARERMKTIAAPANAIRLDKKTPCAATGACQECSSPQRICSQELITGWQMIPGRIRVILLGEPYGY